MTEREFLPLPIAVLTVSDTRTEADDASGQTLVDRLLAAGHRLAGRAIVPDDIYRIRAVVSAWIADPAVQIALITGGTGMTGRDSTPEAIRPLLDKEIDGFGELFRLSLIHIEMCIRDSHRPAQGGHFDLAAQRRFPRRQRQLQRQIAALQLV